MGFLHPELLLLALPVAVAWWKLRGRERATQVVRALVAAALVLAAGAPYLRTGEEGRDLVFVVDRSRSMPGESEAVVAELTALAEEARSAGDRVALVAFGADVGLEQIPQRDAHFDGYKRALDRDGSDLGGALDAALALIPSDRSGSLLLVSDGEGNGRDPLAAARRAFARGVRIDVRPILRDAGADVAVERLELPEDVGVLEPFQFGAWVRSDEAREIAFTLERDGAVLSSGTRSLEAGLNRLSFRDLVAAPGVAIYRLKLDVQGDRVAENNAGIGAVRVAGQRSVLVVNDDGAEDSLVHALRAVGIPIAVARAEDARLSRTALTAHRAVVLENVAAERIGSAGMRALREFVLERGGGLLMTGGRASFGIGGWYLSPVDELLPVSMEMRQENRKIGVALVVALDRSGSMAVEASPGVQKIKLANLGTCAAIELLSPLDSVGVIAVDSSDHTVQELTRVDDVSAITARVRTIESMGGGIFCYTALYAAGRMLDGATQQNRHIILFADAADSEEQENVPELLARFRQMGITVSVVALGTKSDSDAQFLERTAAQGGGTCYFTNEAKDLPRLFAQDTLTIARATWVEEPAATKVLPDLFGLGEVASAQTFPQLDGYNLTWLRHDATAGVITLDEFKAPAFAFAQRGLGRTAAFTGQIGGEFGARSVAWDGFASFFVTIVRWLAGQEEPLELFASARRVGRDACITVEVDPSAPAPPDTSKLVVRLSGADGSTTALPLERVGEHRYEAHHTLARDGVVLGSVDLGGGRMLSLPPLALPYSPEFETSPDARRGERLLRRIARESGGEVAPPVDMLFRGERVAKVWRVIARELVLLALLLLVLEIAARRLQLWGSLAGAFAAVSAKAERLVPRRRTLHRDVPATQPAPRENTPSPGETEQTPRVPPKPATLDDALTRARRAASRELDR